MDSWMPFLSNGTKDYHGISCLVERKPLCEGSKIQSWQEFVSFVLADISKVGSREKAAKFSYCDVCHQHLCMIEQVYYLVECFNYFLVYILMVYDNLKKNWLYCLYVLKYAICSLCLIEQFLL